MSEYRKFLCSNCDAKIYVNIKAYCAITEYLNKIFQKETGGILIGHYSSSLKEVYINELTFAPNDSQSGHNWFVRGIMGIGVHLKKSWDKYEEYYLGEWHFHPADVKNPSFADIKQMQKIARDKRFNCKEPLLLVFSRNDYMKYYLNISLFIGSNVYKFYEKVACE